MIGRYDKFFGGKPGAAQEALNKMKRTYGPKKGETVFHATVVKREHKSKKKGLWR